jgi:hypothetical protein
MRCVACRRQRLRAVCSDQPMRFHAERFLEKTFLAGLAGNLRHSGARSG